jgi:hypothetical protein
MGKNSSLLNDDFNSYIFIALSLITHILIFTFLQNNTIRKINSLNQTQDEINIYIENEPKENNKAISKNETLIPNIIVSPSNIVESKETPQTNKLSDKMTKVEKEQIKRGDPLIGSLVEEQKSEPKKNQQIKNLFLDKKTTNLAMDTFINELTESNDIPSSEKIETESASERIQKFVGISGNADFLPNVPDGEITMLNAKADRFAVFVRRVALQVFSALRNSDWSDHPVFQSNLDTDEVIIRAIMSKDGRLINTQIIKPSSHASFDSIVLRSVNKGVWDKNPPEAALTPEGNISFIFK